MTSSTSIYSLESTHNIAVIVPFFSLTFTSPLLTVQQMLRYHLFGETVDVAAKCEQTCVPGRVHVTDNFAQLLSGSYDCEEYLEDLHGHKTFLIKEQ